MFATSCFLYFFCNFVYRQLTLLSTNKTILRKLLSPRPVTYLMEYAFTFTFASREFPPISTHAALSLTVTNINRPVTLIFDLLTSKQIHGMCFRRGNFWASYIYRPFRCRVRSRHATDRQTDWLADGQRPVFYNIPSLWKSGTQGMIMMKLTWWCVTNARGGMMLCTLQNSEQEQHHDAVAQHLRRHAATANHVRSNFTSPRVFPHDDVTAWRHSGDSHVNPTPATWSLSGDNWANYCCKWQVKLLALPWRVNRMSAVECVTVVRRGDFPLSGGASPLSRDVIPWRHAVRVSIYRRIADRGMWGAAVCRLIGV